MTPPPLWHFSGNSSDSVASPFPLSFCFASRIWELRRYIKGDIRDFLGKGLYSQFQGKKPQYIQLPIFSKLRSCLRGLFRIFQVQKRLKLIEVPTCNNLSEILMQFSKACVFATAVILQLWLLMAGV